MPLLLDVEPVLTRNAPPEPVFAARHRAVRLVVWLAPASIALALVLAATRIGIGITSDSGHYLAIADSLVAGQGFVRLGPEVMASWPPLYPMLLGAGQALGIEPLSFGRGLNAGLFAVCASLIAAWVHAQTRSAAAGLAAGLATAVGPPLVHVASMMWTEMLFVTLQLVALRALVSSVDDPQPRRLLECAVALALGCLTRYQGVALVAAAAIVLTSAGVGPISRRVRPALWVTAVSLLPLGAWLARNLWQTGTLVGPRFPSDYPWNVALLDLGQTAAAWFVPWRFVLAAPWAGLVCLTALVAVSVAVACGVGSRRAVRLPAIAALAFGGCFALLMLQAVTSSSMDALGDRLLAPLYMPLVVIAAMAVARVAESGARLSAWAGPAMAAAVVLALLATPVARTARQAEITWHAGPGGTTYENFNTAEWRSSPTLDWARQHLTADTMIFASSPAALYLTTRLSAHPFPRKHARRAAQVTMDRLDDLQEMVARTNGAVFVVLDGFMPSHSYSLEELRSALAIEPLATFADGQIFAVQTLVE